MKKIIISTVLLYSTLSVHADVALHGLFTDNMVLQRDIPVAVYGMAEPGEKVTVAFVGKTKSATAGKDGAWSVKLDAMKFSATPAAMTVAGKNTITLNNVLIGDVWLCSGQSNMELTLGQTNRPDDITKADFPTIRLFHVPNVPAYCLRTDTKFGWGVCTPQAATNFSAVGFYFARKITQETGVPIGLMKAAWGGTRIEPWISYQGLASIPELAQDKETLDKQINTYVDTMAGLPAKTTVYVAEARKALANNTQMPAPLELPVYPINGTGPYGWNSLYNGMIHPLTKFGIKGVLWYQGEANGGEGEIYFQKMRALIGGWRKAWNQGDFPFYLVQLANHQVPNEKPEGGDGWAKMRMAQMKSLTIPNTGMAVAIELADADNPKDIHPKNKKDVGERLALWALAKDYGKKGVVCSGPLYKAMKVEGAKIRIAFDSVGSGLTAATKKGYDPMVKEPQGKLQKFAIAGEDKKWVWADALIDGKTVVVSSPGVPSPVAVRYAYSMNPDGCNLYNNEGLPASPFRTDEW